MDEILEKHQNLFDCKYSKYTDHMNNDKIIYRMEKQKLIKSILRHAKIYEQYNLTVQIVETIEDFKLMVIQLITYGRRQQQDSGLRYLAIDFEFTSCSVAEGKYIYF